MTARRRLSSLGLLLAAAVLAACGGSGTPASPGAPAEVPAAVGTAAPPTAVPDGPAEPVPPAEVPAPPAADRDHASAPVPSPDPAEFVDLPPLPDCLAATAPPADPGEAACWFHAKRMTGNHEDLWIYLHPTQKLYVTMDQLASCETLLARPDVHILGPDEVRPEILEIPGSEVEPLAGWVVDLAVVGGDDLYETLSLIPVNGMPHLLLTGAELETCGIEGAV